MALVVLNELDVELFMVLVCCELSVADELSEYCTAIDLRWADAPDDPVWVSSAMAGSANPIARQIAVAIRVLRMGESPVSDAKPLFLRESRTPCQRTGS